MRSFSFSIEKVAGDSGTSTQEAGGISVFMIRNQSRGFGMGSNPMGGSGFSKKLFRNEELFFLFFVVIRNQSRGFGMGSNPMGGSVLVKKLFRNEELFFFNRKSGRGEWQLAGGFPVTGYRGKLLCRKS
jgi:hypothetical protein